jgi:electron transport complex protein RnfB
MDKYKKLAEKLDKLPNRYLPTESGVEVRMLEKIFLPEEAAVAAEMFFEKESAAVIASRVSIPEKEAKKTLKSMVRKELILFSKGESELIFGLMPFAFGFYEMLGPRLNEEIAELFEQYFQETKGKITGDGMSIHRVVPVQESIKVEIEIFPYEKASDIVEKGKSWGVRDCICRVQKELVGDPCGHPKENCLVIAPVESAFDNSEVDRALSKEEALQILLDAEDAGLIHTTGNYQANHYICNCCTCSCGILRSVVEYNNITGIARSDFMAVVDEDHCTACGDCLERCQFNALNVDSPVCEVDSAYCVGCGLCVPVCPDDALVLLRRTEGDVLPPPITLKEWGEVRLNNRSN